MSIAEDCQKWAGNLSEDDHPVARWLTGRGVNLNIARMAQVGAVRQGGEWHVTYPFFGLDNLTCHAVQTRGIRTKKIRWAPGSVKVKELEIPFVANMVTDDNGAIDLGAPLVICEGQIDALVYASVMGLSMNIWAVPGAASWRKQWATNASFAESVTYHTDGDAAGEAAAKHVRSVIASVKIVHAPQGRDLADVVAYGGKAALELLENPRDGGVEEDYFEFAQDPVNILLAACIKLGTEPVVELHEIRDRSSWQPSQIAIAKVLAEAVEAGYYVDGSYLLSEPNLRDYQIYVRRLVALPSGSWKKALDRIRVTQRREHWLSAMELMRGAVSEASTVAAVDDAALTAVSGATGHTQSKNIVAVQDVCGAYLKSKARTLEKVCDLPFESMNDEVGGLHRCQILVWSAYTGEWKSWGGTDLAKSALIAGKRVLYVSLEMPPEDVLERMVEGVDLTDDTIGADVLRNVAQDWSGRLDFYTGTCTAERLCALVKMASMRGAPYDLVVLDHLNLLDYSHRRDRRIAVDDALASFRMVSNDIGTAFMILCQLNRPSMKDSKKPPKPRPWMLRESGGIEQIADLIMFTYVNRDDRGEMGRNGVAYFGKVRSKQVRLFKEYKVKLTDAGLEETWR